MKVMLKKGFTLIELLVVIAIIGILSSVVLASLNTARAKGADAAIKSNLANIRAQASLYYDDHGSTYGTAFAVNTCSAAAGTLFADTTIFAQITSAATASGGTASCVSTASAWAVAVPLKNPATDSWCVDSTGKSSQVTPASGDLGFSGAACK